MSQGEGPATDNPVAYISHHLQPLTTDTTGFWKINIDTMFFSILIALVIMVICYRVGRNITAGAPTGMQNVLETLIDFVNGLVKEAFPKPNKLVGPLGLTIFMWVFLMNAMDLVPVDLLPKIAELMGIHYLKVVPTTDPHTTFAMALTVFALCIYYNIKIKGPGGYFKSFLVHPSLKDTEILEIHNRPNYIKQVKQSYNKKIFLYFHNLCLLQIIYFSKLRE